MLLGEHKQAVDGMGQLALPRQILSELEGSLVVTRGFDRNLILFTDQEWRKLADKLAAKPISNQDVRILRRRLFSNAVELTPNEDGRIILPSSLRKFAGINGQVILTGMYNHVELWSEAYWTQVLESIEADSTGDQWNQLDI